MKKISDEKIIEATKLYFSPAKRYHRYNSYSLKHVLQQIDGSLYLQEGEFIRLMKKAGFKCKPSEGQSVYMKVCVKADNRINRELWGMGDEKLI